MLVLFPIACWGMIALALARQGMPRRAAFLAASIVWGGLLAVFTEMLSLFGALSKIWIASLWGGATVIAFAFFFLAGSKVRTSPLPPLSRAEKALTGGIAFLCLATFCTALLYPPNNWDSMTYHMSRVVHWLQNRSVAHYPTSIIRQLELSPWAEFAIAHFQALSGGDRYANLVQWFSMIGSVVGATLVAAQLGARRRGQILAAVLAASIPMGILQASSTQNDYAVAFWILCFVWSGLELTKEPKLRRAILAGVSLGLAILTKATAYLFAFPFFCWFVVEIIRRTPRRATLLLLVGIVLPVFLLNSGHWHRNWTLFSSPFTSSGSGGYTNETITAKTVCSNVVRNGAIHLATPFDEVNRNIEKGVVALHQLIGSDINDQRTTWPGTTFRMRRLLLHEDYSGNPLHAVLAAIAVCLLVGRRSVRRISGEITPYFLAMTAGFLLFCSLLRWQPWHSRLHLPLFVLGAPAIGVVLGRLRHQGMALAAGALLLFAALPWALWNVSRPLAPAPRAVMARLLHGKPLPTTIFTADRMPQYFTNRPALWQPYFVAASLIKTVGARNIGLILHVDDWEYPLWALTRGEDGKGPRFEHMDVKNRSGAIGLGNFRPDLIVKIDRQGIPEVMKPQTR